ncbi:octaprenyl-diphosphate synthase [Bacteroides luti]|uniref:Octaprenyl-diphosphate synthase n=1 Tax=Bacteroides luti TaxID=1297750 RepID=A0A1M4Z7G0_9BACE|nr:polyprenyl synthetase family protein [Bacteroides luti]SHF13692.1 octaprenyl-diphosphate synthase [Bacteroides luti]
MDRLSQIKSPIISDLEQFKELFNSSLDNSNPLLQEVLSHIKQRGGKMMRPILVLLIARLLGKVTLSTLHAAVSLELLHTASLVHDDVVDESSERRGQASVNAVYNNKISILVGDYLLATCLYQAAFSSNIEIIKVVSQLGQDLSEGELLQLSNVSNIEISETVYFDIIRKKTAALFSACTKTAALSSSIDAKEVENARLFGEYIGICFQIKDDIFDYYDDREVGKPTGNDMREGKLTLPAIYAINNSNHAEIKALAVKIKSGSASDSDIKEMIDYVKNNGGIEYATKVMMDYHAKALRLIESFPESEVKSSLTSYLDYVVDRTK